MNRIILIGNGFDLAHKIRTSYYDFLNHFWEELYVKIQDKEYREERYEDEFIIIDKAPAHWISGKGYKALKGTLSNTMTALRFKNKFLENLSRGIDGLNWVDIESDYYTLLKACFQKPHSGYTITELNDDFSAMKKHLELYLKQVEKDFNKKFPVDEDDNILKRNIYKEIYSDFKLRDFSEDSINKLTEQEFQRIHPSVKALENDHVTIQEVSENHRDGKLIADLYHTEEKNRRRKLRELLVSEASPNYFRSSKGNFISQL